MRNNFNLISVYAISRVFAKRDFKKLERIKQIRA